MTRLMLIGAAVWMGLIFVMMGYGAAYAGSQRVYFDPDGNRITESEYRKIVGNDQTSDASTAQPVSSHGTDPQVESQKAQTDSGDTSSAQMDQKPETTVSPPTSSASTGDPKLEPDEPAKVQQVFWVVPPETVTAKSSPNPPTYSQVTPQTGIQQPVTTSHAPPQLPGQKIQPVRVIEQEINVPGSGVLKVKKYVYEE